MILKAVDLPAMQQALPEWGEGFEVQRAIRNKGIVIMHEPQSARTVFRLGKQDRGHLQALS